MNLNLSKPIAFIDLETTGLDVATDRIVEISILKILPDDSRQSYTKRINPLIPIPAESSAIHGIYDKDVEKAPSFKELGVEIRNFIDNADLAGYNSNKFDIPLLLEEFYRNEIEFKMTKRRYIDVQNIFHKMEKRTLEAAYKFYCNKSLENAHSAAADVEATFEVLEAQLDRYSELEPTVPFLHEFAAMNRNVDFAGRIVYNDKNEPVFNFGKHKGKSVKDIFTTIDPSYYSWMINGDFTQDTKRVITEIKLNANKD